MALHETSLDSTTSISEKSPNDHKAVSLPERQYPGTPSSATRASTFHQYHFFSSDVIMATARKQYLKVLFGGVFATTLIIFTVFALLWGAFFRTPSQDLSGWIVDFDGGMIGKNIVAGLTSSASASKIAWTVVSADEFPSGLPQVSQAVGEHKTWIAVTINPAASSRLSAALTSPNATYDGSEAISAFAVEARNENAFRVMLRPSLEASLTQITARFAAQLVSTLSDSPNLPQLMRTSPQTITLPVSYKLVNLHPFDQPLASVVIFTGLIFVMILAFFVVMIANGARDASDLHRLLTLRSLITLRISTCGVAYLFVSLFYSLLSLAFQLKVDNKFGHSGFLVFWMMNFCGMCSVGLAIESMLTLLTATFIPFFLLTWMMVNVAVCVFPIEVLPKFYRYGYAAPFYNISKIARTIVFGVKNQVGFHFGVLIIWGLLSCATLVIFQYLTRRSETASVKNGYETSSGIDESLDVA